MKQRVKFQKVKLEKALQIEIKKLLIMSKTLVKANKIIYKFCNKFNRKINNYN